MYDTASAQYRINKNGIKLIYVCDLYDLDRHVSDV